MSFAIGDVPSWGALGASMVLVMFAYSGMETALVPSGEINDPARDVPRATMVAILLVVLLYLGDADRRPGRCWARQLAESGVPVADTAGALWSPGRVLLLITACISMTGFLMGNLFGTVAPGVRAGPRRLPAARASARSARSIACRCGAGRARRCWRGCWRSAAASTRWR